MCGIAGISFGPQHDISRLTKAVARMSASMFHRGPDDGGAELIISDSLPHCFLASRRLAILDVSHAGHQPMEDEITGNCIVLNGEIYNHLQIRRELSPPVGGWKSTSDTETILQAYAEWGIYCVNRLRGMFSFAIWDASAGALWCARDRLGIKPLYFCENAGIVFFASEVRALLSSGLLPRRIDRRGLAGFVRFGSVPEPFTLIEGVLSLQSGHLLRLRRGAIEEITPYWQPTISPTPADRGHMADCGQRIRTELERAVSEHLLADVPVASFLSGGLDSSVITALAASSSNGRMRTFTVGFQEAEYDESEPARTVSERFGCAHTRIVLSEKEIIAKISAGVSSTDLPSADGLNTFIISQSVADSGIKVVLSGLGGDELFGGYRTFAILPRVEQFFYLLRWIPAALLRTMLGETRVLQILEAGLTVQRRYEVLRAFWSRQELNHLGMSTEVPFVGKDPGAQVPLQTRISVLELGGYMQSTLLRDGDAMSMANSIEMRLPFLDHQLVELCFALGVAGRGRKHLLVQLAHNLLPPELLQRRKQGFVLPMDKWMRGPLRGFVDDGINRLAGSGVLHDEVLSRLSAMFDRNSLPWARLWQFVVLGHWLHDHMVDFDEICPSAIDQAGYSPYQSMQDGRSPSDYLLPN